MDDAVDLLKHDHRMVEQLFRDYHAAASDRQRRAVVETLVREPAKWPFSTGSARPMPTSWTR